MVLSSFRRFRVPPHIGLANPACQPAAVVRSFANPGHRVQTLHCQYFLLQIRIPENAPKKGTLSSHELNVRVVGKKKNVQWQEVIWQTHSDTKDL